MNGQTKDRIALVVSWTGILLCNIGGSGVLSRSEAAGLRGEPYDWIALAVCVPLFGLGCALVLWANRKMPAA